MITLEEQILNIVPPGAENILADRANVVEKYYIIYGGDGRLF